MYFLRVPIFKFFSVFKGGEGRGGDESVDLGLLTFYQISGDLDLSQSSFKIILFLDKKDHYIIILY